MSDVLATGTPIPTEAVPVSGTSPGGEAMSAPSAGVAMATEIDVPPGRLPLASTLAGAAAGTVRLASAVVRVPTTGRWTAAWATLTWGWACQPGEAAGEQLLGGVAVESWRVGSAGASKQSKHVGR